jgi:carbon-monoxide dehydrogenase iron sulfur subunit
MNKIYVKEEVCMGCHLCEVFCRLEHSHSKDLIKAFKQELPSPLARCSVEIRKPVSLSLRCQNCEDAPCLYYCLTGALHRDTSSGIVIVDENKCIGCWTCLLACPFGAIRRDTLQKRIVKCDLCGGKEMPVCVSNCPNEALVYYHE